MTLTIRQRWVNVQKRHYPCNDGTACSRCGHPWPCPDYADAVAALDQMDAALRIGDSDLDLVATNRQLENEPGLYRLVPDPAPPTENT